jgi:hypothetical protein
MPIVLAAPLLLLVAIVLPSPLSRLAGLAALAVVVGLTWRAAMMGSVDLMLLTGGAMLARRFGFPKPVSVIWARRFAKAFTGFVFVEFGVFALLVANLTGDAVDALPFALGMLLSGVALAKLMSRRQAQVFARQGTGRLVSVPSQASLSCA